MTEWQPIEKLTHGLGVLAGRQGFPPMPSYRDATGVFRVLGSKHNYTRLPFAPTHFAALPSPPKTEDAT